MKDKRKASEEPDNAHRKKARLEGPDIGSTTSPIDADEAQSSTSVLPSSSKKSKSRKKLRPDSDKRPNDDTVSPVVSTVPNVDPLTSLPLELLCEVLVNTRSTKDVLAVARCNRYLWKTLATPLTAFVWNKTRQITLPDPMPDPPSMLSEPAYASMVFDGGRCEFCNDYTKEMYTSFALRLRVCKTNKKCKKASPARHGFTELQKARDSDRAIWERTPTFESSTSNFDWGRTLWTSSYWPDTRLWCRTKQMKQVQSEYGTEDKEKHQDVIKKNKEWMEFCVALSKWKHAYITKLEAIKEINEKHAKSIAKSKGYNLHDLLNETSYGALHYYRIKSLQSVTLRDFHQLESKVDAELKAVKEKRKRSAREAAIRTIRGAIEKYFRTLQSETPKNILPPFATFRRLPTLASLLALANSDTSDSIQEILKTNGVRDVVKTELAKWVIEARKQMAVVLGYPDWKPANKTETHPADRVTAWFLCKECTARAVRYGRDIYPLSFAKACSHECFAPKGQRRKNESWDASIFVKDDKAIAAIKKVLEFVGKDESHSDMTWLSTPDLERAMKCLSCRPFAILTAKDLVGHCHRHEGMEIEPVVDNETEERLKPIRAYTRCESGLAQTLMKRSGEERHLKDCGCRYCLYEIARQSGEQGDALVSKQHRMTVNGLRSHLKAKHGFEVLRDEDVFIFPEA